MTALVTVSSVPARTHSLADLVNFFLGTHGNDFANNLMPWDTRKSGGNALVLHDLIATRRLWSIILHCRR